MLQMKRDKGLCVRNTAAKAAFQSCPDQLDHWLPQAGAAGTRNSRGTNKNVQHHMTRTLPFSENFSMVSESGVLKQDVTEAILLFSGRKGTSYEYTGLQFNMLLFKSSAFFCLFCSSCRSSTNTWTHRLCFKHTRQSRIQILAATPERLDTSLEMAMSFISLSVKREFMQIPCCWEFSMR